MTLDYYSVRNSVLGYLREMFREMEVDYMSTHQEKLSLLEDVFSNATDVSELRVAFERWYADHSEDLELEHDVDELWELATLATND